jgi:Na+/H+-dicarboxylate symporter
MQFSFSAASLSRLSRSVNRPSITLSAVAIAVLLGVFQAPFLGYIKPIGDFYVALLQMCVLPFLLTTIPLAVRSAMTSGTAGPVARTIAACVIGALAAVALTAVIIPELIFLFLSVDDATLARIGSFVGSSGDKVDIEFALNPALAGGGEHAWDHGILAFVPTNIFAALSNNDSMRVLVFVVIFGIGMVLTERDAEPSLFASLQHIQAVCILIFECFGLLMPIGIVALIAPQVALIGADIFSLLAMFCYAFFGVSIFILVGTIFVLSLALRIPPHSVFSSLLKPMMLGASTRNTLVCIPLALETLTKDFRVARAPCELFIPVGFATLRFGTILYFIIATLFMGTLLGRDFSILDLLLVAVLSTLASFATLGVTGLAALVPLAAVLRPFGLSYELAVPMMVIIDPLANMVRVMVNIAVNCTIPALASRAHPESQPVAIAAK